MSHHLVEVPLAVGPDTDEADIVAARLWALGAVGIEAVSYTHLTLPTNA